MVNINSVPIMLMLAHLYGFSFLHGLLGNAVPTKFPGLHTYSHIHRLPERQHAVATVTIQLNEIGGLWNVQPHVIP